MRPAAAPSSTSASENPTRRLVQVALRAFTLAVNLLRRLQCGPASCVCTVNLPTHLDLVQTRCARAARHAREKSLELLVLGKGSNVLFDDRGFDGLVVVNRVDFIESPAAVDDTDGGAGGGAFGFCVHLACARAVVETDWARPENGQLVTKARAQGALECFIEL
jgi:hypothetical protein